MRHRHQRKNGVPVCRWQAHTRPDMASGRHPRHCLRRLYKCLWRCCDSHHQRLCLRHRREHTALRRARSVSRRNSVLTSAFDVVIVGAGIAGCACARELAEAGVQVAIIERNSPGSGATAAGMGHIVVMDDSPAQLALTHHARTLWQTLTAGLPAAVEYEERGTLWIAADEEEVAQVHAKQASCTRAGVRCEVLDAAALREAEPHMRHGLAGALLGADEPVFYPPAGGRSLLGRAHPGGAP